MGIAIVVVSLLANDSGRFDHMDGWGGGWMWLWGTLMMLTWVVIIAAAVYLVTRAFRVDRSPTSRARDVLDTRYAQGEIGSEEYEEKLERLR